MGLFNSTKLAAVLGIAMGLVFAQLAAAQTQNDVPYIDENGVKQIANNVTLIDKNNIASINNLNGWYLVVNGDYSLLRASELTVSGTAHLILEDGCNLRISGGINVSEGNSLTIYAQSTDMYVGKLTATVLSGNAAGIGGYGGINGSNSNLNTINGGNGGDCGIITINGGMITAAGGYSGAGIGGGGGGLASYTIINSNPIQTQIGNVGNGGNGGTIAINGGTVTAYSYDGDGLGAGIGGGGYGNGGNGGNINISGGTITAYSESDAGIGGNIKGGNIIISGGTISATSKSGAGIGGATSTTAISGGTISSTSTYGAGIGGAASTTAISGGNISTTSTSGAGIGGGTFELNGNAFVFAKSVDDNDVSRRTGGILFIGNTGRVYGNVELQEDLEIKSSYLQTLPTGATLTIPSGAKLVIPSGIKLMVSDGASLAIPNGATLTNRGAIIVFGANVADIINSGCNVSNGITLAWNKPSGTPTYTAFTNNDITLQPETATAVWRINEAGKAGIDYTNGENTGFIALNIQIKKASESAPEGLTATFGQTLADVALPTGWAWESAGNTLVGAVGTRTYKAKFTPTDVANYNVLTGVNVNINVVKADYDMLGVALEDAAVTYNGQPHSIFISGTLPNGVNVSYTGNEQTAIGKYTITATFSVTNANYNVPKPMTATLTINNKKTYDMSGVTFENKTIKHDGQAHSITISGTLPAGVTVSYIGNEQTAAGEHRITAIFSTSDTTYNVPSEMIAVLIIEESSASPIRDVRKQDNKHGILLEKAVVSQSAKISVKTPEQAQIDLVIYDNAGNVVYKTSGKNTETFVWNLTNLSGRNVANGSYLIVVEAKGAKGNYAYSAKVGVKR